VNKKTTDFYEELKKKEQKFKYSLKALSIADISHRGQKRKFINEDYINHPVRVAWKIFLQPMYASPTAEMFDRLDENIAIALCHDVFEDTKTKSFLLHILLTDLMLLQEGNMKIIMILL
jgi:(p)ppGpp synthase/HD superfamily hydrolase